jgi:hypothetical protein
MRLTPNFRYDLDGRNVLTSSIHMIGAWLHDSKESKEIALDMHGGLTGQILQRLVCRKDVSGNDSC